MTVYFQKINNCYLSDSSSDEEENYAEKSTFRAPPLLPSTESPSAPSEGLQGRIKANVTIDSYMPILTMIENKCLFQPYKTIKLSDLNPSDGAISLILDIYLKDISYLTEKDKKWLLDQEARIRATQNKDFINKFEKFKASVTLKPTISEKKT